MKLLGVCTPEVRDKLSDLLAAHERIVATRLAENPITRGSTLYYTNIHGNGCAPRVSPEEAAQLGEVTAELLNICYSDPTTRKVLTSGFIVSPICCGDQPWHFDFRGKTENIFVPLVPLTPRNGTEYVRFESESESESLFRKMCSTFADGNFIKLPPLQTRATFDVRRLTAEAYSIVRMPFHVLHRGVSNQEERVRTMFFIATTDDPNFDLRDYQKSSVVLSGEDD